MKIKVKKSELKECIKNAVVKVLSEQCCENTVKEFDDEDEDDAVSRFLKNPKNQLPKRLKGAAAAKKAALADINAEQNAEERDEKTLEKDGKENQATED